MRSIVCTISSRGWTRGRDSWLMTGVLRRALVPRQATCVRVAATRQRSAGLAPRWRVAGTRTTVPPTCISARTATGTGLQASAAGLVRLPLQPALRALERPVHVVVTGVAAAGIGF